MALPQGVLLNRLACHSRRTIDYAGQAYGICYSDGTDTVGNASRKQGNTQTPVTSMYRLGRTCKLRERVHPTDSQMTSRGQ